MALNFNQAAEPQYVKRIVMGVTRFKGEVEGNEIDSCSVFVATPLGTDQEVAKGFGCAKIRFGDSSNFTKHFNGLVFPCELELAFGSTVNSKGQERTVLLDVRVPAQSKG